MKHGDSQVFRESQQLTREWKHGINFGYSILNTTSLGFALETLMKSQDTQKNWEAIIEASSNATF